MSAITVPLPPAVVPAAPQPEGRRLGRTLAKVLLCVLVVVVASSCTGRAKAPTKFGDTTRKNFIAGCVDPDANDTSKAVGLSNTTKTCTCAYTAITKAYTFAQFNKLNADLSKKPAALPAKMQKILKDCSTPG